MLVCPITSMQTVLCLASACLVLAQPYCPLGCGNEAGGAWGLHCGFQVLRLLTCQGSLGCRDCHHSSLTSCS